MASGPAQTARRSRRRRQTSGSVYCDTLVDTPTNWLGVMLRVGWLHGPGPVQGDILNNLAKPSAAASWMVVWLVARRSPCVEASQSTRNSTSPLGRQQGSHKYIKNCQLDGSSLGLQAGACTEERAAKEGLSQYWRHMSLSTTICHGGMVGAAFTMTGDIALVPMLVWCGRFMAPRRLL